MITRFTSEQYENKSITGDKLADDISITSSLAVPIIKSGSAKLINGAGLVTNGSTLTDDKGYIFKYDDVDLVHIDSGGNIYIRGNIQYGGTLDSVVTTVQTLEVADYEIKVNASVDSPYSDGATKIGGMLSVNRGDTNYVPYLAWHEDLATPSNNHWKLYDGINTSRIVDRMYGDTVYASLSGAAFTGNVTIANGTSSRPTLSFGSKTGQLINMWDTTYGIGIQNLAMYFRVNKGSSEGFAWFAGGTHSDGQYNAGSGGTLQMKLDSNANLTVTGDISVGGNKLTFGNGSYISNETDGCLNIVGDGSLQLYGNTGDTSCWYISSSMIGTKIDSEAHCRIAITPADGKLGFGSGTATRDTWLYRSAANTLKTDGDFIAGGDITVSGNKVSFGNGSHINNETDGTLAINGDGLVDIKPDPVSTNIVRINSSSLTLHNTAEANARFIVQFADGKIGFGPGSATRDTWLYRDNINSLKTDGAFTAGAIGGTTFNKVTITAPTVGSTLTIGNGKTLTANSSITLAGADSKTLTLNNSITLSASNDTSTLNIGAGGTLGTAAFTASTAYQAAIGNGAANQIWGMNNAANAKEWKTFGIGASGTAPTWSLNVANAITLNIPMASTASVTAGLLSNTDYAKIHSSHPDASGTTKGYMQVGTGLSVANGVVSVVYGTTAGTAVQGNDSRLISPIYARITFPSGTSQAVWNHNAGTNNGWADYIVQITPSSPETHYYYTSKSANSIIICLDDPAYEQLDLDVMLIVGSPVKTGFTIS